MEKLRRCDKNITRAHQIVVRDDGFVVGMVQKTFARNYGGIASLGLVPRMRMVLLVEILLRMLVGVVVHVAKVNFKLIVLGLDQRMHDLDPFGAVALHFLERRALLRPVDRFRRRLAKELAVPRCGRCENDARHKPRGGDFAQEYQQDGAQLPAAEFAVDAADDVDLFHAAIVGD